MCVQVHVFVCVHVCGWVDGWCADVYVCVCVCALQTKLAVAKAQSVGKKLKNPQMARTIVTECFQVCVCVSPCVCVRVDGFGV